MQEIEVELRGMDEQIEDTNDFIKIHLNSKRNRMIKLGLYMEMSTLSVGVGALCAGAFGMNLTSGLEEHPQAFMAVSGGILTMVAVIFGGFYRKLDLLGRDYSSARTYQALKHFFNYIEGIDGAIWENKKTLNRNEFGRLLEPVVGSHLSQKEVDALFNILDQNVDGKIDHKEVLNLASKQTS